MFKRLLSFILMMCVCLTLLPSDIFISSIKASTISTYGFEDNGGGNSGDVIFPSTPTVDGGDGNGTWVVQKDNAIFLKSKANARSTGYYYNTIGWTIHKQNSGTSYDPNVAEKIQYVPLYLSDNAGVTGPGNDVHKISGSGSEVYFYNHDGEGKYVEADRTSEPGKVIQLYKIDKTKFLSTLVDKGYDTSSVPVNKTHRFYLSAASRVTRNDGSTWAGPFTSLDSFKSGAGQALWDVVGSSYHMYFNIPIDIKVKAYNTVSFYDVTTGERLQFNNAGKGVHKYTVPEKVTIDGKVYKTLASANYPWVGAPEKSSEPYLEAYYKQLLSYGHSWDMFYKSIQILSGRGAYPLAWTSDPGDEHWVKTPRIGEGIAWNNTASTNLFGNSTIVYCMPESVNVVAYDNSTGKPLMTATTSDGSYEFADTISTDSGVYRYVQSSIKESTNIEADKLSTLADFRSGKPIMGVNDKSVNSSKVVNVPLNGIGRGEYAPIAGTHILYYNSADGTLIKRDTSSPKDSYTVQGSVDYDGKKYKTIEVSYKVDRDPEVDITETRSPVMTATDKNVTTSTTVSLDSGDKDKQHIVRVSCKVDTPVISTEGSDYLIPAQYLTQNFTYDFKEDFKQQVDESSVYVPEDTTHRYVSGTEVCHHYDREGKHTDCHDSDVYSDCTISYRIEWLDNKFDWVDDINTIVPNNLIFAGKGSLTAILGNWHATAGSFNLSVTPSLKFTSHRKDVDGHVPTFAAYMESENSGAKSFLKNNQMGSTVTTGLTPSTNYTSAGGSKNATVSVTPGSDNTPHGRAYRIIKTHSSCGDADVVTEGVASPSTYTSKVYTGKVVAEPSIVASAKSVATKSSEVVLDSSKGKATIYQSPSDALKFYPTYKMFAGGNSAWLLGKVQRNFMPVDVFEIEVINIASPLNIQSMWSRDAQDAGRLVMKGGYTYGVSSKEPIKIKLTSYIHVPKANFVENSSTVRSERLKAHTNLVSSLSAVSNYKLFSNLPEAYQDSYPTEWKIQNRYKQSGDNVLKSRMSALVNPQVTKSSTTQTTMKLSDIDSLFGTKTDSTNRVKGQLETNSWYVESFDGFEVIKQVTTISVTFNETVQTNFLRNGGASYNDLAKAVGNIPANKFGVTLGIYNPNLSVNGKNIDLQVLTKPVLFDVRGTLYDDRN